MIRALRILSALAWSIALILHAVGAPFAFHGQALREGMLMAASSLNGLVWPGQLRGFEDLIWPAARAATLAACTLSCCLISRLAQSGDWLLEAEGFLLFIRYAVGLSLLAAIARGSANEGSLVLSALVVSATFFWHYGAELFSESEFW